MGGAVAARRACPDDAPCKEAASAMTRGRSSVEAGRVLRIVSRAQQRGPQSLHLARTFGDAVHLDLGRGGRRGQTRRAEGSKRRKAIQRPDPPTAMVRRRDERPLIAIRVGHERLDAPALVLWLAEPGNVVLL